ncbi:MAG: MBL fold metallo-hydrolase [Acidobacteriota bacterium]
MRKILTAVLVLAFLSLPILAEEEPLLTIEKLTDGVFAFLPTEEAQAAWRAISNSGAVVLDDGVLVFDSHWTPAHVEAARALLKGHTDLPIRYAVLSHHHGDHSGGAWAYAGRAYAGGEVEIISHHANRELLENDLETTPEELPAQIEQQHKMLESIEDPAQRERMLTAVRYSEELLARIASDAVPPLATLTFEKSVVLHRGRPVEIHFLGRGHTRGDAILFLPEEKIVFLGDLLFHRTLPNLNDGFSKEWIATLEKVLELEPATVVPGHGAVTDADGIRHFIGYLKWLRSAVEPFAKDNAGAAAAVEGIELPEKYAEFEFTMFFPGNVRKVYEEMVTGE